MTKKRNNKTTPLTVEQYRDQQVALLPTDKGVYALCDLDEVPIYVGTTVDGLRKRVQRHLTSARSDIIANRALDIWEVAYVWAWKQPDPAKRIELEAHFYNKFHKQSKLVNAQELSEPENFGPEPDPDQKIQILPDDQIELRKRPEIRLPRQAKTFLDLVAHIVEVKNNEKTLFGLQTHFERLEKYVKQFLKPDLTKLDKP
jgi:hypothetical protein